MRLYGAIQKVEPQDDGTVRVYGIATSEAVDEQGEIVRADAIRAAIPNYMHFPALREMHQLSAAGSTLEAEVCEDGTTRIIAHVVDPVAVAKVRNQVYRGFSIGGRVTQREAGNPKTITGLVLNEISLVDRPANPEAIFDCWKAAISPDAPLGVAEPAVVKGGPADTEQAPPGPQPFNAPIQIWACTVPDHRHLAKADALKCLEGGAGLAEDRRATATAGPPSTEHLDKRSRTSLTKALRDVGQIARIVAELEWLREALELEAAIENDQSPQPARLQAIITELCDFLSSLATEEFTEMPGDAETDGSPPESAMPGMLGMADAPDLQRVAAVLRENPSNMPQLAKAKHSPGAQALLHMAHFACDQYRKFGGLSVDEEANMDRARHYLQKTGAMAVARRTAGGAEDEDPSPAREKCPEDDRPDLDQPHPRAQLASDTDTHAANLANALPNEPTEKTALAKVLGEVVPMIERLTRRVDEIARTPLPPLTMAKGTVSVSKEQDRGSKFGSGDSELSPEAIAAALAKMTKEEQTLTLIKASYATPIRIAGSAADQP